MKKVFIIIVVSSLLTACNNDASSDKEGKQPVKEVPVSTDSASKKMDNPSHNMMPPDSGSTERRPRD